MNYISDTLCHFVGRSKSSDDERFELLLKIIKDQKLKANLENPDQPVISSNVDYRGDRLGEVFNRCDCVCFCDIPNEMLEIHTLKYSKFGIGFSKTFLSKKGVHPVMYIPAHGKIVEYPPTKTPLEPPMDYYLHLSRIFSCFNSLLLLLAQLNPLDNQLYEAYLNRADIRNRIDQWDKQTVQKIMNHESHDMLFSESIAFAMFLAYVKIFDETLDESDPDNYYMEREWRGITSINFSIDDIQKIYLPNTHYKKLFLEKLPDYKGDFWIFDEK